MKIIHEKNKCIGCAACTVVCPEFFEMDEERKAILKGAENKNGNYELEIKDIDCFQEAVDICPVQIIKIEK